MNGDVYFLRQIYDGRCIPTIHHLRHLSFNKLDLDTCLTPEAKSWTDLNCIPQLRAWHGSGLGTRFSVLHIYIYMYTHNIHIYIHVDMESSRDELIRARQRWLVDSSHGCTGGSRACQHRPKQRHKHCV